MVMVVTWIAPDYTSVTNTVKWKAVEMYFEAARLVALYWDDV